MKFVSGGQKPTPKPKKILILNEGPAKLAIRFWYSSTTTFTLRKVHSILNYHNPGLQISVLLNSARPRKIDLWVKGRKTLAHNRIKTSKSIVQWAVTWSIPAAPNYLKLRRVSHTAVEWSWSWDFSGTRGRAHGQWNPDAPGDYDEQEKCFPNDVIHKICCLKQH